MYKLLAAAIVSVFMIIFIMLFAPGTKKFDHKTKQKPVEKKQEVEIEHENIGNLMSANVEDEEKPQFKKLNHARTDAASHGMDEKFFISYNENKYETMCRNMEERLISIAKARIQSERAKKGYGRKEK